MSFSKSVFGSSVCVIEESLDLKAIAATAITKPANETNSIFSIIFISMDQLFFKDIWSIQHKPQIFVKFSSNFSQIFKCGNITPDKIN